MNCLASVEVEYEGSPAHAAVSCAAPIMRHNHQTERPLNHRSTGFPRTRSQCPGRSRLRLSISVFAETTNS